jgi:hypothetical protein
MRVRHKVPSLFTLSMVDVLCCALGCVILLWLLNARQAVEAEAEHRQELDEAQAAARAASDEAAARGRGESERLNAALGRLLADREEAAGLQARLEGQVRVLEESRLALESRLKEEQALAAGLRGKLKTSTSLLVRLEGDAKDRAALLAGERKRAGALAGRAAAQEEELKKLAGELARARDAVRAGQKRSDALASTIDERQRELDALGGSLADARSALAGLKKSLAQRDKELAAYRDRTRDAEERARFLTDQLGERQAAMTAAARALAALEKEKRSLRAAADNRFAGIELTGKRVIFLVDTSGSMAFVDEKTPAPHKWVEVRRTVARLMQSLPGLEKFQLITFAEKSSYPLGGAGKWLDYDAKAGPKKVLEALAAAKPAGGTNMYAALDAAFRYRADGLDTVYLLSDGLPNLGEGLSAEQERALKDNEVQRGAALGRHVRLKLTLAWNRRQPGRPRVRVNTIGFFYESPDLGAFLWALARENDGSFVGMSKP